MTIQLESVEGKSQNLLASFVVTRPIRLVTAPKGEKDSIQARGTIVAEEVEAIKVAREDMNTVQTAEATRVEAKDDNRVQAEAIRLTTATMVGTVKTAATITMAVRMTNTITLGTSEAWLEVPGVEGAARAKAPTTPTISIYSLPQPHHHHPPLFFKTYLPLKNGNGTLSKITTA
jgi:hypothetical protein